MFLRSPMVQVAYALVYFGEELEWNALFFQLSHITCLLYEFASFLLLHFFCLCCNPLLIWGLQQHTIHVVVSSLLRFLLTLEKLADDHWCSFQEDIHRVS